MKGYFGIGIEGASKAVNVGTLFRTAHAFGASFVFTVRAQYNPRQGSASDTSDTPRSVPTYHFADLEAFRLPLGCRLVGIEITDDAIDLPSFRHPRQAAYIVGSEREGLSARHSVALRLRGEDPDPLFGQSGRRRRPGHVRPAADPRPPRAAAGGRGRADRGRPAAGVRRSDLPAPATDPAKSAFKTVDWAGQGCAWGRLRLSQPRPWPSCPPNPSRSSSRSRPRTAATTCAATWSACRATTSSRRWSRRAWSRSAPASSGSGSTGTASPTSA